MYLASKSQKENKPYSVDQDALNEHPGFATTIFISWDDIAEYFDYFEDYDLQYANDEATDEFREIAFNEARNWANLYTKTRGLPPSDDAIVEKENAIIASLQEHWSAANVLLSKFDFEKMVTDVNTWSHGGAKDPKIFGNPPSPGKSIETFFTLLGISFTVYKPFMIPYIESYYHLHDNLPEWNYEDLEALDIIETLFAIQTMLGNHIDISIKDWESKWVFNDA